MSTELWPTGDVTTGTWTITPLWSKINAEKLNVGLAAHWDFDEASGSIRYSHDGQSNFTYNQNVPTTGGKFGQAPLFQPITGSVLRADHNSSIGINAGESFSIGLWVYLVSGSWVAPNGWDLLIKGADSSWPEVRSYGMYFQDHYFNATIGDGTTAQILPIAATYSAWQYFMMWYDADTNVFYAQKNNGTVSSGSFDQGSYTNTGKLKVGAAGDSGVGWFASGAVDNLSIWKRVLTSDERAALYNGGTGLEFTNYNTSPDSDVDWISSIVNPTNQTCEVKLSGYSNPNTYTGHILNYRYQKVSGASADLSLIVGLYDNTTLIAQQEHTNVATGWITSGFTLTTGQAATISDYNNLRLRFTANRNS